MKETEPTDSRVKYIHSLNDDGSLRYLPGTGELHPDDTLNRLSVGYEKEGGRRYFYNAVPMSLEETRQSTVSASQRIGPIGAKRVQQMVAQWRQLKTLRTDLDAGEIEPGQKEKLARMFEHQRQDIQRRAKAMHPRKKDVVEAWERYVQAQEDIIGFVCVPQIRREEGRDTERLVGPFPVRATDFAVIDARESESLASDGAEAKPVPMATWFRQRGVSLPDGVRSGI